MTEDAFLWTRIQIGFVPEMFFSDLGALKSAAVSIQDVINLGAVRNVAGGVRVKLVTIERYIHSIEFVAPYEW